MKKLLLIPVLLFSFLGFAQMPEISPYFPQNPNQSRYQTQFTYYDLNYVSYRVQDYLERNMAMVLADTKENLKEGVGTIEHTYQESMIIGSSRSPQKIKFTYTVVPIGNYFVIKKCKIAGEPIKVEAFFVGFWKTSLQFDRTRKEGVVYNNYLQDKISFYFNNGNYYVDIINTSISNFSEFRDDYLVKKKVEDDKNKELDKAKELAAQQEKAEQEENERLLLVEKQKAAEKKQKQLNTKVLSSTISVEKRKGKIKFPNNTSEVLIKDVESFLKDEEDGDYSLQVSTTYEYEVEVKNELRVYRFTPHKGVGKKLLNRIN